MSGVGAMIISAVSATVGLATAGIGIAGSVSQYNQQKANLKAQEQQQRYNQKLEEREAQAVEAETRANAQRQKEYSLKLQAAQRAALGKSGAAMDSGTPLALLGATAADEQMRQNDLWRGGYRGAMQHREQAKMFGYSARMSRASRPSGASLALNIGSNVMDGISTGINVGRGVKSIL